MTFISQNKYWHNFTIRFDRNADSELTSTSLTRMGVCPPGDLPAIPIVKKTAIHLIPLPPFMQIFQHGRIRVSHLMLRTCRNRIRCRPSIGRKYDRRQFFMLGIRRKAVWFQRSMRNRSLSGINKMRRNLCEEIFAG